jgi:hypothetical protein
MKSVHHYHYCTKNLATQVHGPPERQGNKIWFTTMQELALAHQRDKACTDPSSVCYTARGRDVRQRGARAAKESHHSRRVPRGFPRSLAWRAPASVSSNRRRPPISSTAQRICGWFCRFLFLAFGCHDATKRCITAGTLCHPGRGAASCPSVVPRGVAVAVPTCAILAAPTRSAHLPPARIKRKLLRPTEACVHSTRGLW